MKKTKLSRAHTSLQPCKSQIVVSIYFQMTVQSHIPSSTHTQD